MYKYEKLHEWSTKPQNRRTSKNHLNNKINLNFKFNICHNILLAYYRVGLQEALISYEAKLFWKLDNFMKDFYKPLNHPKVLYKG